MSQFLNVLKVSPYSDGCNWCVLEDFTFEYGPDGSGCLITVPQYFITDFASVPRCFWNIIPPWGTYGPAVVGHDWNYYNQVFTRAECDTILMEAMTVLNVSRKDRTVIYDGVRLGGQSAWDENKRRKDVGFIRVAQDPPTKITDLPFYWVGTGE